LAAFSNLRIRQTQPFKRIFAIFGRSRGSVSTSLNIRGELAADASVFSFAKFNLTSRRKTQNQIAWSPSHEFWSGGSERTFTVVGKSRSRDRHQTGFNQSSSMVFLISGSGLRARNR